MEISLYNKQTGIYREIAHMVKRTQESIETVVPDTNDDIGKIADIQTELLLKSKDVTARTVSVTGEINAAVLYINENADKTEYIKVSKSFRLDYELPEGEADCAAQIKLSLSNAEARAVNPRKISVIFDVCGELYAYRKEQFQTDTGIKDGLELPLHTKTATAEVSLISAICEKTFTFAEQYPFPPGKAVPTRVIGGKVSYHVNNTQFIGTKVLVKGTLKTKLTYQAEDCPYPLTADFSSPFSQLVDASAEDMDSCSVVIEATSAYFDLIDTISEERVLDAELHAVLQLTCRSKKRVNYLADAYSNLYPVDCVMNTIRAEADTKSVSLTLNSSERINVSEDCADVLAVFTDASEPVFSGGKISASVPVSILYNDVNGDMNTVRRLLELSADSAAENFRDLTLAISDAYFRPNGPVIDCSISARAVYLTWNKVEYTSVSSLNADEEAAYDLSAFPSLTLVRGEDNDLWQLAKRYHSSVEKIEAANDLTDPASGKMLLVPKAI